MTIQDELLGKISRLNEIGIALSSMKDITALMEAILDGAIELTGADGGTYYSVSGEEVRFEITRTNSLGIVKGGSSGEPITYAALPLYVSGEKNLSMAVTCAVHEQRPINITDAYQSTEYDLSGTQKFDQHNDYRTSSLLTVPMANHEDEVIGVLQLVNCINPQTRQVIHFSESCEQFANSLASQAAIALTNNGLIRSLEHLFESMTQLIAAAIDTKSPYTGAHCRRIPAITMMLAEAVHSCDGGPFVDFRMTDKDRYELNTAAWLHDCGKISIPDHIMDKATKLEGIYDGIENVDLRIEVVRRDVDLKYADLISDARDNPLQLEELNRRYQEETKALISDRDFLRWVNIGGEFLDDDCVERIGRLAKHQYQNADGVIQPLLREWEVYNLSIRRGTLNPEERTVIEDHMVATVEMLDKLPFPKHLKNVPEYAGGHHERMDGTGYPKGLKREEMSVPARVMAIADVFEALSAKDRPYKQPKPISECLRIMSFMCKDSHLDPDLFRVFLEKKVWLEYAETFLPADQIDIADAEAFMPPTPA
ncbi:MAG: GAF domain-containing protein [Gammaproteobacteria bacterium]|nr:GAF domain-containing protein [Pseudomonadota bacterium]MCH9663182.1 GAF domain-containing protein [Gammaproteobacteria bacterium]